MKNKKLIRNIDVFNQNETLRNVDILIEDGVIKKVGNIGAIQKDCEIINGNGLYCIPGFIDLQVNGGYGSDIWDANKNSMKNIIEKLPSEGTTRFIYTYISADVKKTITAMKKNAQILSELKDTVVGAVLEGFHTEGPFIDKRKKGTHSEKYIIPYDEDIFESFWKATNQQIKMVTFTPTEKTIKFVETMKKRRIIPSIGHTAADNDDVLKNINSGAIYCTHLFNGMTGIHHRETYVAHEFLINPKTTVMFINDLIHLSKNTARLILESKSFDQIILVTDAVSPKGLTDGIYEMGPIKICKINNKIHLERHPETLAGSATKMNECYKNVLEFNFVSINDAVKMSSYNQAKALGISHTVGSIKENMHADLIIMDKNHNLQRTICHGNNCYVKKT